MKKILIPLDHDPSAEKIALKGYSIAKALNAKVIFLHVIEEPDYYSTIDYSPIMGFTGFNNTAIYEVEADIKKEAMLFLEEIKYQLGDPNIRTMVLEGDFAPTILRMADDCHADMIIMGTHSRRGLDKLLMGNLSEKILQNTSIPLLVIPNNHDPAAI